MKRFASFFTLLILPAFLSAQLVVNEEAVTLHTPTGDIYGTLKVPATATPVPVVLLIGGSGPTDRNGNQPGMQSNALLYIADGLYKQQIASLCFDKRGIAASKAAMKREEDIRFEHYIDDVKAWVNLLAADKRFSSVIVAGHSEGAQIGMIASVGNPKVTRYISLAGPGRKGGDILKEQLDKQLAAQMPALKEQAFACIDQLEKGETCTNVPPLLQSLFRPAIQPYLISWLKYDPQLVMAKVTIPALILQGSTDIQVTEVDANLLAKANPKATKVILPNINHVLKDCASTDQQTQLATYTNPSLPINPSVVKTISDFIRK